MEKSLDEQWEDLKPKILALLEEGWSRPITFRRIGIHNNSKIYNMCYKEDHEFLELITKYRQKSYGFYRKILSEKTTNQQSSVEKNHSCD
jgi:hypothetical protein